jgi:hypothetical protein
VGSATGPPAPASRFSLQRLAELLWARYGGVLCVGTHDLVFEEPAPSSGSSSSRASTAAGPVPAGAATPATRGRPCGRSRSAPAVLVARCATMGVAAQARNGGARGPG